MSLCLAAIGSAAQRSAADSLGDGALDAGPDVVAGFPLRGLLVGALLGKDLLLLAGQQGQAASPLAIGRRGAPGPQRARAAAGEREMDPGNRGAAGFALVGPADADRSLGAGRLLCVPVDAEGGLRQGRCLPGAAAPGLVGVGADRPEQGDAVVVAGGEDLAGADVSRRLPHVRPAPARRLSRCWWMGWVISTSSAVASVVSTFVITWGLSGSQVSVRWAL